MIAYFYTPYFENEVLRKRPYLRKEWCVRAIEHAVFKETEFENQRIRFWAPIGEMNGRFLRVVTLEDAVTIHNAFFDRRFKL